ncbi:hypothetical protein BGY98DRAFT_204449 [Russula aff. rugulosa BPL654]|nr:hypothetical protein BGY98DRAFT_204449 [Russula aff. rugulosa BPL654]
MKRSQLYPLLEDVPSTRRIHGMWPILGVIRHPVDTTDHPCHRGRSTAVAWAGALAFDTVIFFLTLYKAFKIGRGVKLLHVIVRDGTMYFSALSLMNLGNIMNLLFAPPLLKTSITSYANVLATILVNRLVLNLRERAFNQLPITVETVSRFQAALPLAGGLTTAAVNDIRSRSSFVRQKRSTATVTGMESPSQ